MDRSVVAIAKGTDPEELVQRALDLVGGIGSLIQPGATVVIKPNAGHVGVAGSSVNTTPEVVTAVINAMKRATRARSFSPSLRRWGATRWSASR